MKNTPSDNPVSEKYRALKIDGAPIIEEKILSDHKELLKDYLEKHGKPLKPVNRRSKHLPPSNTICPICSAPYEFIYDNSASRGQLGCKVCKSTFYPHKIYLEKIILKCHIVVNPCRKNGIENIFLYTTVSINNAHSIFII